MILSSILSLNSYITYTPESVTAEILYMFTSESLILICWRDKDIHKGLLKFFNKTEQCIVLCELIVRMTHMRILLK